MTYYDWKKQYDALSERDRRIYDLARSAVNSLGFALQNTHSDRIVEKYETKSDAAMKELFEVLAGAALPASTPEEADCARHMRDEIRREFHLEPTK